MLSLYANIKTHDAERYLRMLCKHFAHKVPAESNESTGWIAFAMGRCELKADSNSLEVICFAENRSDLDEVAETMKSHFDRFAQKQQLQLLWAS